MRSIIGWFLAALIHTQELMTIAPSSRCQSPRNAVIIIAFNAKRQLGRAAFRYKGLGFRQQKGKSLISTLI
jgi:hypothetical protein